MPPLPSRTCSEVGSALSWRLELSPTSSVASQDWTSMVRSWPAFAAAPLRPVSTCSEALSGPSLYVPV